ncbi:prepilin peptidase [Defluviimonas aestuarii]|uniref:prepilin peptidase n=1 Tax=Albidovulum aestuarii TaxID=1130726 RepID=UPI002499DFEA|nr:prepilin peptidase [Defluviimonas aestuarii]MDI3336532.1 prepilin peptidase [Defluviimonas aestuarii]
MLNPYDGTEAVTFAYQVFLVLCLPVCAWVAWSDLKFMKIPNKAVYTLAAIFAVAGLLLIPFDIWVWRWLSLVVVLVIGFVLNAVAGVGAGDVKFASAAAPFFFQRLDHAHLIVILLAAFLLGAFATHRLLRAIPAVRAMTPDWISWTHKKFPMGLALVGTLLAYLTLLAFPTLQGATG